MKTHHFIQRFCSAIALLLVLSLSQSPVWASQKALHLSSDLNAPVVLSVATDDADFYVATTGDDVNAGTLAAPFKTLEKAKIAVREALPTATAEIKVYVRGGTYELTSPLEFGILDAGSASVPVTYSAYPEEVVEISGTETLSPTWTSYSENIMVANIGTGHSFDVLFANDTQQVLARYPNYDADIDILNGYAADAYSADRAATWSNPTTGLVRALHDKRWGGNSFKISGMSDGTPTLEWVGDNNRGSGIHDSYRMVENIFEELDAPGEWFYDQASGQLYLYPTTGMDLATATIEVATSEELIRIVGTSDTKVKYLTFDGFTYSKTARTLFSSTYEKLLRSDWAVARKGAIFIADAENITISNSTFDHLGGNAIFISAYNRNHLITQNEFTEIGATCVNIVGLTSAVRYPSTYEDHKTDIQDFTPGPLTDDYPKDITVSYNHMYNMGRFEKQTCGVNLAMAESITVSHNTIHRSPRSGLNVGTGTWGGHLFEYNDVFDCVRESNDHGPFNAWGRDRFWSYEDATSSESDGAIKAPYAFLDAWKTTIIRNNRFHYSEPTGFGIDLDDGCSNYEVYNNLILNSSVKLREGFGRKVYNNIAINRGSDFHAWYAECKDTVMHNITVVAKAYNLARLNATTIPSTLAVIDSNLFYNNGKSVSLPFATWTTLGYDANTVTADPLFTSPASKDYTVKTGSPALTQGFVNFPMDQFGKPGSPEPGAIDIVGDPNVLPADPEPLMGAQASSITSLAIQSAIGASDFNGVYLESVPADSYAASQGFLSDDLITSINGVKITTKQSFWLIYNIIKPGDVVAITRLRDQVESPASFIKMSDSETLNNTAGVVFGGTWQSQSRSDAFNGDLRYNRTAGRYFEIDFYGTGISYTSQTNSDMGDIDVYIDGVLNQTVSCYSATRMHQQTVFSVSGLSDGVHTLKAVNAGVNKYQLFDSYTISYNPGASALVSNGSASASLQLYPNPANDFLMIDTVKEMANVSVFNMDGQELWSQKASGTSLKLTLPSVNQSLLLVSVLFANGDKENQTIMMTSVACK